MKPEEANLSDWYDNQIVMQTLHISDRTLQYWRKKGILPYTKVQGKIFYHKSDIQNLLLNHYKTKKS